MEDTEFSPAFCNFIKAAVPSVDSAELLLLFYANPGEALTAEEAAHKTGHGMEPHVASKWLAGLESSGLLWHEGGRYQYRSTTPVGEYVETLAQAYRERPVTLVRIIYALRDSTIESFSDAFRLRRNSP